MVDQAYDFNDPNAVTAALLAPLPGDDVSKREGPGGGKLDYLKWGDAVVTANEIFGPLGWDFVLQEAVVTHVKEEVRDLVDDRSGKAYQRTYYQAEAMARGYVRTKLCGAERGDVGYDNSEMMPYRYMAVNLAIKAATSDCQKRCLRSFGFRLGLALYFKEGERVAEGYATSATPGQVRAPGGAPVAPPVVKDAKGLITKLTSGSKEYVLTQAELKMLSDAATASGVSAKEAWIASGAKPPAMPKAEVAFAFLREVDKAVAAKAASDKPSAAGPLPKAITDVLPAEVKEALGASDAGVPMSEIAASAAKAPAVAAPVPPTSSAPSSAHEPAIPPIVTPTPTTPSSSSTGSSPAVPAAEKPKRASRAKPKDAAPSAAASTATAAPSATQPSAPTPTPTATPAPTEAPSAPPPVQQPAAPAAAPAQPQAAPAAQPAAPPPMEAAIRPGLFSVAFLDRVTSMPADQRIPQEAMREIGQVAKQNGLDPTVVAKEKNLDPTKGLTGAQAVVLVKALVATFFARTDNAKGPKGGDLPAPLQTPPSSEGRLGKFFRKTGGPLPGHAPLHEQLLKSVASQYEKLRAGSATEKKEAESLVTALAEQGFTLDAAAVAAA